MQVLSDFVVPVHLIRALNMSSTGPSLNIPRSLSTVQVRLIDTGAFRDVNAAHLFKQAIKGFDAIRMPSWSFLISHGDTHILFDLSIRKDWKTGFPPIFDPLIGNTAGDADSQLNIHADSDVREIIESDNTLKLNCHSISACIWSHHHFDHRGDIGRFPASTQLILGPGLRQTYLPGYPTDPDGELSESDFEGRPIRELEGNDFSLEIGGSPAHDYFGNGSLYLLSTPGHTTGHISALARTTIGENDTFVLMAGDCAHHPGVFRPSQYLPLPDRIYLNKPVQSHLFDHQSEFSQRDLTKIYDGSLIQILHPRKSSTLPFLDADDEPLCESSHETAESVEKLMAFDADDNILVLIAHDNGLTKYLPVFPGTLDHWKASDAKERLRWEFLNDFDIAESISRE